MSFAGVKAVVFDLDGTLVDSAPDIVACLNHVLERRGVEPFPLSAVRTMIGGGARKLLQRAWAALYCEPPDSLAEQYQEFITAYSAEPTRLSKPFPGAEALLVKLRETGVEVGLCTNKPEAITRQMLENYGWTSHFTTIIGGDTTPAKKPDPTPLLAALEAMNAAAHEAVMVGDSDADLGAAQAIGARCVLVRFGYSRTPVEELGGDALIDHLGEVFTLVTRDI